MLGPQNAVARGRGDDDRVFQGFRTLASAIHILLFSSPVKVVANAGHEAELVIDEDKRGVFRGVRGS